MKKGLFIGLSILAVIAVTACGTPGGSEKNPNPTPTATTYTITYTSVAPTTGNGTINGGVWVGQTTTGSINLTYAHDYPTTVPSATTHDKDSFVAASDLPSLAQVGWKFVGWEKDGALLANDEVIYMDSNKTLNAKWEFEYTTGWIVYKNAANELVIAGDYSADIGTPYGILVCALKENGGTIEPWIMSLEESDAVAKDAALTYLDTLPAGTKPWKLPPSDVLNTLKEGTEYTAMKNTISTLKAAIPATKELSGQYWTEVYKNNDSSTGLIHTWQIDPLYDTLGPVTDSYKVRGFRLFN